MKYRSSIIVTVEFDTDEVDAKSFIRQQLNALLPPHYEFAVYTVQKIRLPNQILGEFDPDEVLQYVNDPSGKHEFRIEDKIYTVGMNSSRYQLFKDHRTCEACGLTGVKMLLELPPGAKQPHFNLYAIEDGKLVLMTKDHKRAKSKGGEENKTNFQNLCSVCNMLKGSSRLSVESVTKLRKIYNDGRRGLSKKHLTARLRKARQSLVLPAEVGERESYSHKMRGTMLCEHKAKKPELTVAMPVSVIKVQNRLVAMTLPTEYEVVYKLSPGTRLATTGNHHNRKVGVLLDGQEVFVYHGLMSDMWRPENTLRDDLPKAIESP